MRRSEFTLPILVLALALLLGAASGCAASLRGFGPATIAISAARDKSADPAALSRSLFDKPAERQNLSEEVIQRVVNAPIDLEFPARAGVVLLSAPFSRSAYASLQPGDEAPQLLAREIERSSHFVMVSDISPYLADGQHVESLRELATRYRLKYLVVLNARFADRSHVNNWGWGWVSLVGIPFLPAYTLRTTGLLEATLLDVRTGTFLFTTQIHVNATQRSTPFATQEKLEELQREVGRRAARVLAERFLAKCNRLVAEVQRRARATVVAPPPSARDATTVGQGSAPTTSRVPPPMGTTTWATAGGAVARPGAIAAGGPPAAGPPVRAMAPAPAAAPRPAAPGGA